MSINFKPLAHRDLPQLCEWLNTDHVIKWFGKKPMTFDDVEDKYGPYITGEKPTKAFIIMLDGIAAGYIQTYLLCDYPDYNAHVGADAHTAGVDLFIGHPDYIHKGYGKLVMSAFIRDHVFLDPQVHQCVIGPEPKNLAAIKMYEKAGFRWFKTIQIQGEPEPEYLMKLEINDYMSF